MKALYDYVLIGMCAPFVLLLIAAGLRSYILGAVFAGIGMLFALGGVAIGFAGLREAHDVVGNFAAFAGLYAIVAVACFFFRHSVRPTKEERLARIRQQYSDEHFVLMPFTGFHQDGACWECGNPHAPLRQFRLVRVVVLPVAVGGESVTTPIPLCAEHSSYMHTVPHWVRMLCGPFAFLVLILPLLVFGDFFERQSETFRKVEILSSLVGAIAFYFFCFWWANQKQHLQTTDTGSGDGSRCRVFSERRNRADGAR